MSVKRPPDPTAKELSNLACSLARRIAHQDADIDDLMQEGLISLHRMLQKVPHPDNPFAFARTLMQRCMLIYYSGGWRFSGARHREDLSWAAAPMEKTTIDPQRRWDNNLDLGAYLNALEGAEGALARQVAENLLMPQDEYYCSLLFDTAKKKAKARELKGQTAGVNRIRPSHYQLRMAFNLNRSKWHRTLHTIRRFTANYLAGPMQVRSLPMRVQEYQEHATSRL